MSTSKSSYLFNLLVFSQSWMLVKYIKIFMNFMTNYLRHKMELCCFDWISSLKVGLANCCRQPSPAACLVSTVRSSFISEWVHAAAAHLGAASKPFVSACVQRIATASPIRAFIPLGRGISAMLAFSCCFHFQILRTDDLLLRGPAVGLFKTNSCDKTHHTHKATLE